MTKRKRASLLLGVPIAVVLLTSLAPSASAATANQQISELQQNNAQADQNKQTLGREASNLSGTITALQAEIATLDGQINQTQGKVSQIQKDITAAETELARQRTMLTLNVREMYTEHDITTLEMLASSKNFSHFVDQEQYRSSLQDKINSTTKHIETLMHQLESEKKSVENLLVDQKAMQENIASRRAESTRLLGLNQEQQKSFEASMSANNAKIAQLRSQQVRANKKDFVSKPSAVSVKNVVASAAPETPKSAAPAAAGTSYPWASTPFPNSVSDPWGMYKRQCVSYTAWKVASSGRHMPYWGGRGNAKLWDDNARKAGIPVDNNPRVGDVAVSNAGAYGHVMYVEAVHGDGTITISQYNADWKGNYSEGRRKAAGLVFVHF